MDNWQYHNKKMIELKKLYNKTSKQTQNKLQGIFDTFNFTSDNLYNIADIKTKNRANTYIEEWKDKDLLTEYFGTLAKNIYGRTRVKNNEILELLIYGAYIEEQSKLQGQELDIMYSDADYYYKEGQKEVINTLPEKKKKPISILEMALFLALLDQPNVTGFSWEQYIQVIIKYNAEQIYKQAIINIQQGQENNIDDSIYQNIINKQQNARLCINGDKISGAVDNELIGINNLAKVEGIKAVDNDAKVRFIAVEDEKTTQMCHSLDGQTFYIDKENEFDRFYGETQKELRIERIRCKGLVLGLNLPPISHHFHFCRSYIVYLPVESQEETEYNLDIPKISKELKQVLGNTKLNSKVKKLFNKYLTEENVVIDENNKKVMYYDTEQDKIIINPNHVDFKNYNLLESLSHEIIHMIDTRNNISDKLNLGNDLRRAELYINTNSDEYNKMFEQDKYAQDMTLSDIFSAVTNNRVVGRIGHDVTYWNEDETKRTKEISANIMSAYLNDNKDTLDVINEINSLKQIKEKVVKEYGKYTK